MSKPVSQNKSYAVTVSSYGLLVMTALRINVWLTSLHGWSIAVSIMSWSRLFSETAAVSVCQRCGCLYGKHVCGRVPDLQWRGCTKVYSAFHPSGVGKWLKVPRSRPRPRLDKQCTTKLLQTSCAACSEAGRHNMPPPPASGDSTYGWFSVTALSVLVTLTFDLSTSKWDIGSHVSWASFLPIFN